MGAAAVSDISGDFETWGTEHPAAAHIPARGKLSVAALPVGLWSAQAAPACLLSGLSGQPDNAA